MLHVHQRFPHATQLRHRDGSELSVEEKERLRKYYYASRDTVDATHGRSHVLAIGAKPLVCLWLICSLRCPRPQNEQHQLVLRLIETRILSACAARRFFGNTNPCTTRGAQLAFGKTPLRRPQTRLRGRAKTQPPGADCPRDVRDELRSKSGVSATEY